MTPDSAPQDEATAKLVHRLRDDVAPAATDGGDAAVYVSGLNAAFIDIADRIMQRLPIFLLYIIGVTFIVLAMAFRSIVVSLTAAITTILSAFIGFGVLTLVIQEGHLMSLVGLDTTGPIETFVPPIAFAILFGLSMDYMVFLTSRIREEHVNGLKTKEAVEHGIAAIGRVIVAAAIIMGTVFSAFILTSDRISKEFGLLLAVAILDRCPDREDDPHSGVLHALRREDLVHPAMARQAAPEHHHRAAARRRGTCSGRSREAGAERSLTRGGRGLRAPPAYFDEAGQPRPHGGCDRRKVGPQAVITRHLDNRTQPRARWHAERVTLTLHDEGRHLHRVELGEPADRRLSGSAARRHEREGEAENARGTGCFCGPARDAGAGRAAAGHERKRTEHVGAQVVDDGEPCRVEVMGGRRASTSRDAVGLLDEGDTDAFGERGLGGRDEVAGGHATAGAVAEHEPRPQPRSRGAGARGPGREECRRRASARSVPAPRRDR